MLKKALKITGILLLLLIIAAFAIPYFFKDQIVAAVKDDINKSLNAKVDFTDVNLSLFRSFPDFYFSLEELTVTGIDEFENYQLVNAEQIDFSLDLMSVIKSDRPIEINSISLHKPQINIRILKNGKANYDIVKPVESEEADYNFLVELAEYKITEGQFIYDDRMGGTYLELIDLDHSGEGNFTQDIFDFITTTKIESITASSGGVTYLRKAKAEMDLTINADLPNSKYTIKDNQINLNALQLNADGFVQLVGDKVKMDINYSSPNNKFKNFLSMIPSAYTTDFQDVQANGDLKFNGFVKGDYDMVSGALPAFQVNLQINNADFKYPDLPMGVNGIFATTKIDSPSSDLNKMIIDVSNFKMQLGNNPFEAKLKLWTLMSDPNIDAVINGTIDLAELSKAFPMEGVNTLNGIITANMNAKTSMSAMDSGDYENVDMDGNFRIENMNYVATDMPAVKIEDMQMQFTPKFVQLDKFDAKLGKSDIQAQGNIDNFLAYFAPDKTMTGNLSVRSQFFDANEWMSESTETTTEPVGEVAAEESEVFDGFDFKIEGEIGTLLYDVYELKDSRLAGQITPNKATITEFRTKIGESDFSMNGTINNIFNYLYENETMQGDISLVSNYININEFMAEVPSGEPEAKVINETPTTEMETILIPEKMDFNVNANINKVLYTNIELNEVKGNIKVANETMTLKECEAKTLGGGFVMNGTYDTQNPVKPKFDMDYSINKFDFQNAFDKLNTFAALAPIGKFIEGQFNSTMKFSGELGKDMMPDLSTLTADGFLQTLNSTLKNFKPIEELANKLNLDRLKTLDLKNTKNWFEVTNGTVTLKEFDYSTSGIDMVIGGSHSLTSEMTYNIKAKVPRKLLASNAVGQAADKGLDFLKGQASKLGINLEQSEFINIAAIISGTITNPKIKLNLLGANGEVATLDDMVDNIKEQAKDKAKDLVEDKTGVNIDSIGQEIDDAKEDMKAKADAEIASLMEKTENNISKIISEAEKRANQARAEAKKLSDQARTEGYKQADNLVEEAGSNILKKRAAEIGAKKIKEETDKKAEQIIAKGEDTAKGIMDAANKQADNLRNIADEQAEGIRDKYKDQ